jgi:hypothetical protein
LSLDKLKDSYSADERHTAVVFVHKPGQAIGQFGFGCEVSFWPQLLDFVTHRYHS